MSNFVQLICSRVLIESDWNLKKTAASDFESPEWVLIESDWNLKIVLKSASLGASIWY